MLISYIENESILKVYLELKAENLLVNTARPVEKNLIGVSSANFARSKSREKLDNKKKVLIIIPKSFFKL